MKYFIAIFCLLTIQPLIAQIADQKAGDVSKLTLEERYQTMKAKSQTFQDYKVIKENVLDGVWKITLDSIRTNRVRLREAEGKIASMEADIKDMQLVSEQKVALMEEMVYDGTHISMMGISVLKGIFAGTVGLIILGLLIILAMLTGKLKLMYASIGEKVNLINATNEEFEDYKRKSLERQTKLSRELQNERNKLVELRRG